MSLYGLFRKFYNIFLVFSKIRKKKNEKESWCYPQDFGDGVVKDDSKAEECADRSEGCSVVTDSSATTLGLDHFNNRESDPLKSNAMSTFLVLTCLLIYKSLKLAVFSFLC